MERSLEKTGFVDQKIDEIRQLIESRPDVFLRQGSVVESWRDYGGKKLGPYFRLAYRNQGKQRSLYLGSSVRLANAVRSLLNVSHQARSRRRELRRIQLSARTRLRELHNLWDQDLKQIGLYLHGFEVRGWQGRRHRPQGEEENSSE
jgi:hypothetical protein